MLGSPSRAKAEADARESKPRDGAPPMRGDSREGAAYAGDIVVITVLFSGHESTLDEIKAAVADRIVVDAVVSLVLPCASRPDATAV